jgi:S-formylglutathione hydrolase FrmB
MHDAAWVPVRWTVRRAGRLLAVAVFAAAAAPAAAENPARITAERTLSERVVELTISTPALAAPTKVEVFLPAGYDADPSRRWPVVFYLHGANGDQKRFRAFYDDLITASPAIWVAPAGGLLGFYSDWYNAGRFGPPQIETYQTEQLLPLIDARFRTAATRARRAVVGESMGGYGVMSYATRHPDLFAHAASISGALDNESAAAQLVVGAAPLADGAGLDAIYGARTEHEIRWRGHNPVDLADNARDVELQVRTGTGIPKIPEELGTPSPATDCALEAAIHDMTVTFHERLVALGIAHEWKEYPQGCHTVPTFRTQFVDLLPGLERALREPRPDPATFRYRSVEPRFDVWGWEVRADPARATEFLELRDAGRDGATVVGSGRTTVVSPPAFTGLERVDVITDGTRSTVRPGTDGRLRLTVDLGPAHPHQQLTPAARAAGDGSPGYFTTRTIRFEPHGRLTISQLRRTATGARACVRARGPVVGAVRLRVLAPSGRASGPARRVTPPAGRSRCLRLRIPARARAGRYVVRAEGRDAQGRRVVARRSVRLGRR